MEIWIKDLRKSNLKWQRWQCPIYNSTLQSFVWSSMNYISMFFFNCLFWFVVSCKSEFWTFLAFRKRREIIRIKPFSSLKNDGFFITFNQIKVTKGTVGNLALPFLHQGSLEITLTVPLNEKFNNGVTWFSLVNVPTPISKNIKKRKMKNWFFFSQ